MQELFCGDPLSSFSNASRISNLNPFSYWKIGHYHCYTNKLVRLFTVLPFWKKNCLYNLENFFPSKYFVNMFFVLLIWMNMFIFSWIFSHWTRISGCHFFLTLWTDASTNQLQWCVEQTPLPLSPQPWPAHYVSLGTRDCLTNKKSSSTSRTGCVTEHFLLFVFVTWGWVPFSPLWSVLSIVIFSPSICSLVFLMQIHVAAALKNFDWNILHPHT